MKKQTETTQNETPFGEPDHIPHSEMEERFDRQSKENYDRIDKEFMDAIEETDRKCSKSDICCGYAPLTYKERKVVRELIGWQERLLVWMFRIAFLTYMYMYWHVTDVRIRQSMERIDSLEEKVEQLNGICNPTNLLPEAICFDGNTMIARN